MTIDRLGACDLSPIPVGILHSCSGTMAISEMSLIDAERMAIAEINQAGGVLGRQILPVVEEKMSGLGSQVGIQDETSFFFDKPVVKRH